MYFVYSNRSLLLSVLSIVSALGSLCCVFWLVLIFKVRYEENDGEHNAQRADDDVARGQEQILAAQHVGRRKHDVLFA